MASLALVAATLLLDPGAGDPLYSATASTLVEGHEVIMIEAAFAAGQQIPLHSHPGEEIVHILTGSIALIREGHEDLTMDAGESIAIAKDLPHRASAGDEGATAMIVRIHPIGEPLTVAIED